MNLWWCFLLHGFSLVCSMTIIKRIGFGSCSNQVKEPKKAVFQFLSNQSLDLWIWSGDVVYNSGNQLDSLAQAYKAVEMEGSYEKFTKTLKFPVIGTWDDHDFGINDGGGSSIPGGELEARKTMFLDFLKVPQKAPERKFGRGLYSSHEYPIGKDGGVMKIILLDTRSERSNHFLSFVGALGAGTWLGKLSPVFSALIRTFSQLTNFHYWLAKHRFANHELLGKDQWNWLEDELVKSSADINIVVSSIQVLTFNPTVESWALFPFEQERLMSLLKRVNPKGLLLVSGDVHVGQTVGKFEVTSSGLTHTCSDGGIPLWICALTFNLFAPNKGEIVFDRNFGEIEVNWENKSFVVKVQSLTNPASYFQMHRTFERFNPEVDFQIPRIPFKTRAGILSITVSLGLVALRIAHWIVFRV